MSNDDELSSRSVLLNNAKTIEKVPSNPHPRWWLVLPSLLLIILASAADPLLLNDLIVRRYERYYGLNASAGAQRADCRQSMTTLAPIMPILYGQFPSPNQDALQRRPNYNFVQRRPGYNLVQRRPNYKLVQLRSDYTLVQRDASSFNVKNSIATLVPSVVSFILLGSNSDIIGRRPLLVLPFLGKVFRYSFMLIIVSRDLSNTWIIANHALEAMFGSGGLVILGALAYITDCTNEGRTRAFLLTEVMTVVARIIPVLAVSLWLRYYLYIVPLSVTLALSVIGLLYTLFVQPESVESV